VSAVAKALSLPFANREDAAHQLAAALQHHAGTNPLVLAIPRGGVPIGRIIADALGGELDVVLVRKIGAPGNPEFAIGAVDEHGNVMLSEHLEWVGADAAYVREEAARQLEVIRARRARYATQQAQSPPAGRTVIVVDDGLATGATMTAALDAIRAHRPKRLICAVPIAARDSLANVADHADETVCLATPEPFRAVGHFYREFSSVDEDDVITLLRQRRPTEEALAAPHARLVHVRSGSVTVEGDMVLPENARGLVLFAHGSGSSRHSPRNRYVARVLNRLGFGTLLFDLLTPGEDEDVHTRFDIALLTTRLNAALDWALREPATSALPVGLFGASTGAAAALRVAARRPESVRAVVSRGGRPDMAGMTELSMVSAPTLLIVGSHDHEVLALNRGAQSHMPGSATVAVIPGATHLFEEPGTLEQAAATAGDWFAKWLAV
jgi:putative phosphoribosyl transferase